MSQGLCDSLGPVEYTLIETVIVTSKFLGSSECLLSVYIAHVLPISVGLLESGKPKPRVPGQHLAVHSGHHCYCIDNARDFMLLPYRAC